MHFIASTTFADQVACGAAAGAAAAFRAPIGGMLYLMELSTRWRLELTWRTFFSTSITVLVLKGLSRACKGSSICHSVQSFLSVSGSGDYEFSFTSPYKQLPLLVVFAAGMGALGSAFVSLNCAIVKLRRRWGHSKALLLLEVRKRQTPRRAALWLLASMTCMLARRRSLDVAPAPPPLSLSRVSGAFSANPAGAPSAMKRVDSIVSCAHGCICGPAT